MSDRDPLQGAFFGRRKGHALRPRQAALFDALLPRLALDLSHSAPVDLRTLFAAAREVRLESGFGGGEHLLAQAQAHSDVGFIGIEPFVNGMAKMLAAIDAHGLPNIRLHHGDATDVLGWLPAASLTRFDLLYPDPWPKRRHWKRRFVSDESLAQIAQALQPDALFRFASDIPTYVEWTLVRARRQPELNWTAERACDWREPWPGFVRTRYEAKAIREQRTPCYLTFRKC